METLLRAASLMALWQRALTIIALALVAILLSMVAYQVFVGIPLSALRGKLEQEDRKKGWGHLGLGAGLLVIASGVTWLAYQLQIEWLDGNAHVVTVGAFLVGAYELMYGLGILVFRTGALGVLAMMYAFIWALGHWTLKWF